MQWLPYLVGITLGCKSVRLLHAFIYFSGLIGCRPRSDCSCCFVVCCAFGSRFTPLTRVCRICKTKVNQEHHYCQECAFSKGTLMCRGCSYPPLAQEKLGVLCRPTHQHDARCIPGTEWRHFRCFWLSLWSTGICGMCGRKTDDITNQRRTAK